jgi:signal transduction histidine kinase
LAIVTEIIHAHGWEIDIAESTTGGSRFEIVIEES